VTRNPSDRIESANQLVFSVGQRFFVRGHAGGGTRLMADLVTAVDWNFAGGGGLGNLFVEGRLFPVGPVSSHVRAAFDPERAAFEEAEVGLHFRLRVPRRIARAASLNATYRYLGNPPLFAESVRGEQSTQQVGGTELNQVTWTARLELSERVRLSYSAVLSLVSGEGFIRNRGLLEYVSKCRCWGIGVSVSHERRQGYSGGFEIRFLGLGDERSNLFDGGFGTGLNVY